MKQARPVPEVVDPRWLLKAVIIVILAALICGYLTLCLLFYQGQWQLILHPTLNTTPLTTLANLPAQPIRFDAAETGTPRLSGALLPAPPDAILSSYTVLYLRSGDSSLSQSPDDARNLATLHSLGLDLFAFDYRGYGQSDPTHPNQVHMEQDAAAAVRYLTETRAIPMAHLILYGTGVGASLATALAAAHPEIPGLILENPGPPAIDFALSDPRTRLLPVHLLFTEKFSLQPLTSIHTPKLLMSYPSTAAPMPKSFSLAANPKMTLELAPNDTSNLSSGIVRFLGDILPTELKPKGVKAPGVQGALHKGWNW